MKMKFKFSVGIFAVRSVNDAVKLLPGCMVYNISRSGAALAEIPSRLSNAINVYTEEGGGRYIWCAIMVK